MEYSVKTVKTSNKPPVSAKELVVKTYTIDKNCLVVSVNNSRWDF